MQKQTRHNVCMSEIDQLKGMQFNCGMLPCTVFRVMYCLSMRRN